MFTSSFSPTFTTSSSLSFPFFNSSFLSLSLSFSSSSASIIVSVPLKVFPLYFPLPFCPRKNCDHKVVMMIMDVCIQYSYFFFALPLSSHVSWWWWMFDKILHHSSSSLKILFVFFSPHLLFLPIPHAFPMVEKNGFSFKVYGSSPSPFNPTNSTWRIHSSSLYFLENELYEMFVEHETHSVNLDAFHLEASEMAGERVDVGSRETEGERERMLEVERKRIEVEGRKSWGGIWYINLRISFLF